MNLRTTFAAIKGRLGAFALSLALVLAAITMVAVSPPAQATLTFDTQTKSDMMSAVLARINSGTMELWNGTKPASLGTPGGTKLATLTLSNPAGTVSSGVLTIGSVTQTNSSHVNGTPTFLRFKASGGTVIADIDIGAGAGNVQFTGTVVNGQNVTVTGLTLTAGN